MSIDEGHFFDIPNDRFRYLQFDSLERKTSLSYMKCVERNQDDMRKSITVTN